MRTTTWHKIIEVTDRRRAIKQAKVFRVPDDIGNRMRVRIKKKIYWLVEYAQEWPAADAGEIGAKL